MLNTPQIIILLLVVGVAAFGIFYKTTRMKLTRTVTDLADELFPAHDATDSTPPAEHVPVRAPQGTPREMRDLQNLERQKTGRCRYCEAPATKPQPRLVQVIPTLDGLYRRLGVLPVARWRIELGGDPDVHKDALCTEHADLARSHLEKHTQEHSTDYADFVVKQRLEMHEFARYGLDERMKDDADGLKRGKKKKAEQGQGNVVGINSKKAVNQ